MKLGLLWLSFILSATALVCSISWIYLVVPGRREPRRTRLGALKTAN